jgi:hypothetical protein
MAMVAKLVEIQRMGVLATCERLRRTGWGRSEKHR